MEHVAELIEQELKERGWTVNDFVFRMKRYESQRDWALHQLAVELFLAVRERDVPLTREMAEQFGLALDVSPEFFLNMHEAWRQHRAVTP